ncbi:MAG: tetratricopeptide repeat protein [Desulfobulbaceae bacterium]|nr:tetratricopeptide repeat protein [Desulfobulbaceae bacterium]
MSKKIKKLARKKNLRKPILPDGKTDTLFQLAVQHHQAGRFLEAEQLYQKVLASHPNHADANHFLGLIAHQMDKNDTAVRLIKKAIRANPRLANAHNSLGAVYRKTGKLKDALTHYKRAITLQADFAEAHSNLGNVFNELGLFDEAIDSYRKALAINPNDSEAHSSLIFALNYHPDVSPEDIYKESVSWSKHHSRQRNDNETTTEKRASKRLLRIGYVSPDFYHHPVGRFLLPVLQEHDRSAFEIFCYSNTSKNDAWTEKIRANCDHWFDITSKTDDATCKQITEDRIDLLIDLAGHSGGNRLGIFSGRAAPVQANWLGYVNTTGLAAMDYRITDDIVDPPGSSENHYTESLIRLPDGFFCFSPPEQSPKIVEPPAQKTGMVTFGSTNNISKLNSNVISLWSQILVSIPKSRLLIRSKACTDAAVRKNLLAQFCRRGVAAHCIEFLQGTTFDNYLRAYNEIDICLDTFPHNGHTVSCDALWMGCPIITLRGNRYAGRMGADLLSRLDLAELIAETEKQYIDIATALAGDLNRLAMLRSEIRPRFLHSSLCDAKRFTHSLETAFQKIIKEKY